MPDPCQSLKELLPALFGSIAFAGIPLAIVIVTGSLHWIGWLSLAFGMVGLMAVIARLMGWIVAPEPVRQRAAAYPQPRAFHHKGPLPELSASKQAQARRMVKVMTQAGVFAPLPPDPAMLHAGLAEMDWSIKPDAVLLALIEANYYHPAFDPACCMANLVLHETQVEQIPDSLEAQLRDLERLAAGALRIDGVAITQTDVPGSDRLVRTHIAMTVNGDAIVLEHDHPAKAMDGFIHLALAPLMPPDRRLAWLWVDQGAFVTALAPGAVKAMNDAFELTDRSRCQWEWILPLS